MAFKQILPLPNLNFQMNRVLTHGEKACREEELLEIAPRRSIRGRIFTAEEGGDQHCKVGRIDLATDEILDWLDGLHRSEPGSGE